MYVCMYVKDTCLTVSKLPITHPILRSTPQLFAGDRGRTCDPSLLTVNYQKIEIAPGEQFEKANSPNVSDEKQRQCKSLLDDLSLDDKRMW